MAFGEKIVVKSCCRVRMQKYQRNIPQLAPAEFLGAKSVFGRHRENHSIHKQILEVQLVLRKNRAQQSNIKLFSEQRIDLNSRVHFRKAISTIGNRLRNSRKMEANRSCAKGAM